MIVHVHNDAGDDDEADDDDGDDDDDHDSGNSLYDGYVRKRNENKKLDFVTVTLNTSGPVDCRL